jgi:hypothetical protein
LKFLAFEKKIENRELNFSTEPINQIVNQNKCGGLFGLFAGIIVLSVIEFLCFSIEKLLVVRNSNCSSRLAEFHSSLAFFFKIIFNLLRRGSF